MLYNLAKPDFDVEPPKSVWASNLYIVKTSEPNFSQSIENRPFFILSFWSPIGTYQIEKRKEKIPTGQGCQIGCQSYP